MSDTDDTDALLSCDPGGDLDKLLGATMEGFSTSQLDTVTNTSSDKTNSSNDTPPNRNTPAATSASKKTLKKKNAKKKKAAAAAAAAAAAEAKNKDSTLDVSDYFNSEGELVLSGLSQFSEPSVDNDCSSNNGNKSCCSSDDVTNGTVESNTVVSLKHDNSKSSGNGEPGKISNNQSSTLSSTSSSALVKVSPSSVPLDIQDNLKSQILEANKNNPEVARMLEGNTTKVAYGVLNLNLNDLKTFAEGLGRTSIIPGGEKVSTFVPTKNDKGEQVFTRAPNFRTPGGYKPQDPSHQKPCRNLTDEQVREEVRKMYAFPFVEDDEEEPPRKNELNVKSSSGNKSGETDANKPKVEFNFLSEGSPIPNEFGKGKCGKPMKRKLLPFGGAISGSTIGSIPDLGFGVRKEMNKEPTEVREPQMEKKSTYTTGKENESDNNKNTSSSKTASSFSFGYGEEENLLSPIRPTVIQNLGSGQDKSGSLCHSRFQPSPEKSKVIQVANESSNIDTTTTTTTSETEEKSSTHPTIQSITANILGVPKKLPTPRRRLIRKAATKYRSMTCHRTAEFEAKEVMEDERSASPPLPSPLASDLEKILSEIDLPAEDIESLIENFSEDEADFPDVDMFGEVDGNLAECLSDLKLDMDSWKKGKDEMTSDSYYSEKLKREQCEKELLQLQENLLSQKQQNAVLEGTLKRRNMMLVQITVAFNRVCKEWKKFDHENKHTVAKLRSDQKVLAAACKQSKERIEQYEKELHKTLEMADGFKTKVFDVQKERDDTVKFLKESNEQLENKIRELMEEMETLKTERDATIRALRESQVKLDEGQDCLEKMENEMLSLREKCSENGRKYDELVQIKSQQDSNYFDIVERRNELEALVIKLTSELNSEKSEKDQLRREMHEEAERKTRAEAERLHEYYNTKVQDILKSATEEAARAEGALKEQMKRAAMESDRKFSDYKEKCQRELEILRAKYDAEIEKLKRENLHRQLLISSTVKQLQLGESSNLELNSLALQGPRSALRKDLFESLKHHNLECEPVHKLKNANSLKKFTLDHLPTTSEEAFNFTGLKTSTPLEPQSPHLSSSLPSSTTLVGVDLKTGNFGGEGDYRKHRAMNNNDVSFNSFLAKVCSEKSKTSCDPSTSNVTDLKHLPLPHLLEAPVKPEKERKQPGPLKLAETPQLDSNLQKCIQEMLRSYADKFHQDNVVSQSSTHMQLNSVPLAASNNNKNNATNKCDVDSNSNDDECCGPVGDDTQERYRVPASNQNQPNSHTTQDCRAESRKAKGTTTLSQPQSNSKPPWK